nr:MAG TPA: hypothetical protein [Caudoviricetes sp.]
MTIHNFFFLYLLTRGQLVIIVFMYTITYYIV